jgi:hypothetical protein
MKIVITEEQLNLIIESDLKSKIKGVKYIPGVNISYGVLRRIGEYIGNKELIDNIIYNTLTAKMRGFSDNDPSYFKREDVMLNTIYDTTDKILDYYVEGWDNIDDDNFDQEDMGDIFDQIKDFLYDMYSDIINEYSDNY